MTQAVDGDTPSAVPSAAAAATYGLHNPPPFSPSPSFSFSASMGSPTPAALLFAHSGASSEDAAAAVAHGEPDARVAGVHESRAAASTPAALPRHERPTTRSTSRRMTAPAPSTARTVRRRLDTSPSRRGATATAIPVTHSAVPGDAGDGLGERSAAPASVWLARLLCCLGAAKSAVCRFQCAAAIEALSGSGHTPAVLSHKQLNTGWVAHTLGTAFMEAAEYRQVSPACPLKPVHAPAC